MNIKRGGDWRVEKMEMNSAEKNERCPCDHVRERDGKIETIYGAFSKSVVFETKRKSETEVAKYTDITKTTSYLDGDALGSKSQVLGCSDDALECTRLF